MVWTAVSLSAVISLGTSTKRADFLKKQITEGLCLFKDIVPLVSSWLRGTLCYNMSQYVSGSSREPPASALGELMVTIRTSPLDQSLTSYCANVLFGSQVISLVRLTGLPVFHLVHHRRIRCQSPHRGKAIALRLDDWFLRAGCSSQPRSAPVPFFPEVHEELTKSWTPPFTSRSCSSPSPVLTTLDGGAARGYVDVPQVERAVAVQLCPQNATTWRCCPRLLSKAFKLTAALAAKAYSAAGQATSAMHAMVILQVHQAKALKQMHEGSTDHFRIAYTPKSWNGMMP